MNKKKIYPIGGVAFLMLIVGIVAFYLFAPVNKTSETAYLYIDNDDDLDSISHKLSEVCHDYGVAGVTTLARHTGYAENIRTGRYAIDSSIGAFQLFRHLRNGQQEPVRLTIPSVRTVADLSRELSEKMMLSEEELMDFLTDNDSCQTLGKDTATVVCLFVPNTYELYWNMPLQKFLKRMKKESETFWNAERKQKAEALGLTEDEVMTLASIIDEETANNGEKPMVAGMYYNRLRKPMPLQADPTIKFALKQFELRRIYNNMLKVKSPYNTYMNEGLPPGPIRIPSVAGIDAVLNLTHHNYLYMCAKEDFSGTHNFAVTYQEHLQNAAKYTKALNDRGVK